MSIHANRPRNRGVGFRVANLGLVLLLIGCLLVVPVYSALAQEPVRDDRFGAVEVFWDPQAAAEAGVAWERILFYWSQLQPTGPDDWNTLHVPDEWLQSAQASGREVVGLLKNTPAWAASGEVATEASPPRGLELPASDPGNLWAAFVSRAVAHYAPRGVHRWIIWNEPDIQPGVYGEEWGGSVEDYYRLLRVAYQAIKLSDPAAQVHLAGLTYWHDPEWLGRFLAIATADPEGAANGFFFDVVSLHIYFQTDTVDYIVNETRAALNAYGLTKPIWINETNASPDSDPLWPISRPRWRVDLREQASFILQAHALGLVAGAQRIAIYKLVDSGLPPGGEPFGLLRPDHSRRPAFVAYQLVTQHMSSTQTAGVTRDPLWAQVTLNRGPQTTRIFWARTDQPVTLRVPALAPEALLVDQEANSQVLPAAEGLYELTLRAARCVDTQAGCFIGGPTLLLIENAAPGDLAVPIPVDTPAPISRPTVVITGTQPVVTSPAEPTTPQMQASLTTTRAPALTATHAPLPPKVVSPPSPPSPAGPVPGPSPRVIASPTAAVAGSPSPAITVTAPPDLGQQAGRGPAADGPFIPPWLATLALATAVLAALALWRAHRS